VVKLTAQVKLLPTPEQAQALRETIERTNALCEWLGLWGWEHQTFRQFSIHRACYHEARRLFDLTAQVVVRAEAKVSDAYKLDHRTRRRFAAHGAIAYDSRILRWKLAVSAVSIWTVAGRQTIPFVCGERQRVLLQHQQGESDLALLNGEWFLFGTCNVDEPAPGDVCEFLGVDLGIINIAADSDGTIYSGAVVNGLRHRHRRLRQTLQAKGTNSAWRLLKKRRRKESRFGKDVNHCISKKIVATAERTKRGIALEDLKGIRTRIRARKPQRATLSSWSFAQLGGFVQYKAALAGVPVAYIDRTNTSYTCPTCGCIDKRNRPSQAIFSCIECGFSGPADTIAAENIRRAAVNQPHTVGLTA